MNVFIDTEFTSFPWNEESEFISIGVYFEDGDEYYACSSEFKTKSASDFVLKNVIPNLPDKSLRKPVATIGVELKERVSARNIEEIWAVFPTRSQLEELYSGEKDLHEVYTEYADWDFKLMNSLMGSLPLQYPNKCNDLSPLIRELGKGNLPRNKFAHIALEDAKWNYKVWSKWKAVVR